MKKESGANLALFLSELALGFLLFSYLSKDAYEYGVNLICVGLGWLATVAFGEGVYGPEIQSLMAHADNIPKARKILSRIRFVVGPVVGLMFLAAKEMWKN